MAHVIKVLLVDDSPTARRLLASIVNGAPDMEVIAEASDGREAVRLTRELRPDVIAMDLVMPGMNGLDATREIMHATPTPIVVVSASLESWETDVAFEALNRGALAVRQKPPGPTHPEYAKAAAALVNVLRTMAGVHVIHHWKRTDGRFTDGAPMDPVQTAAVAEAITPGAAPEIAAIVCSTGGPAALRTILQGLSDGFRLPVVIAQHIAPDFVPPLSEWLSNVTHKQVVIAQPGASPEPGKVYLAPGDAHLRLTRGRRFALSSEIGEARYIPSGDFLLESVAEAYKARAIGAVLTGMGDDGAQGLLSMRKAGASTIVQDEDTSVVYSMPREARQIGAALHILPLSEIAAAFMRLAQKGGG